MSAQFDVLPGWEINYKGSIVGILQNVGLSLEETRILDDLLYEKGLDLIGLPYDEINGVKYYQRAIAPDIHGLSKEESNIINKRLQDLGISTRVMDEEYKKLKWFFWVQRHMSGLSPTDDEKAALVRKLVTGQSGAPKRMDAYLFKQGITPYTVDVPGLMDIIKIPTPPLVKEQYQKEIIAKMKSRHSPLPEDFQWIPGTIKTIDDMQDLLTTITVLARFGIMKFAPRLLPVVGWALTLSDIANIATRILTTPLTGPARKHAVYGAITKLRGKVVYTPSGNFKGFASKMDLGAKLSITPGAMRERALEKVSMTGFVLQGGQAMESITGYGLVLGGVMALISDSFYGLIRAAKGDRIRFRPPTTVDPLYKPAVFLLEQLKLLQSPVTLETKDYLKLAAANLLATSTLAKEVNRDMLYNRIEETSGNLVPLLSPQEDSFRTAMINYGVDPKKIEVIIEVLRTRKVRLIDDLRAADKKLADWISRMHHKINNEYISSYIVQIMYLIDKIVWQTIMGEENTYNLVPEQDIKTIVTMLENSLVPVNDTFTPARPEMQRLATWAHQATGLYMDEPGYVQEFAKRLAQAEPRIAVTTSVMDYIFGNDQTLVTRKAYQTLQEQTILDHGQIQLTEPKIATNYQIKVMLSEASRSATANGRDTPNVDDIYSGALRAGLNLVNPESVLTPMPQKIVITPSRYIQ